MATFLTSTFYNSITTGGNSRTYNITIDDNFVSGTPVSFTTKSCKIKWEAPSESRFETVIPSVLELDIQVDSITVETALESLVAAQEGRFTIKIEKSSSLYWIGYILADQIEFEDLSYEHRPIFKIKAIDGLSRLKTIDYKDSSGEHFEGKEIVVDHIRRILDFNTFPTSFFTSSDRLIWSYNNWEESNMFSFFNTMRSTRINHLAFVSVDSKGNDIFMSAYEVLQEICKTFGARFFWSNGRYNFVQINGYTNTGSGNTFQVYKWQMLVGNTSQTSSNLQLDYECDAGDTDLYYNSGADAYKLSGDVWGYLPPIERVIVDYRHLAIFNLLFGKTWSNSSTEIHTYSEIDSNGGTAAFAFQSSFNFTANTSDSSVTALRVNFEIRVKVGTKYLKREATFSGSTVSYSAVSWESSSSYYEFASNSIPVATSTDVTEYSNINFIAEDIPEDGDLEFLIDVEGVYDQDGSLINPLDYTLTWSFNNPYLEMWYGGNVEDQSVIKRFKSVNNNTNDNSAIIEIETILGDGPNGSVLGALEIFDGSDWVSSSQWTVGGSGTAKNISQLLANETLRGQTNPVAKMQSAKFFGHGIEYEKVINYFSNKYLPLTVSYSLGEDFWEGLWFLYEETNAFGEEDSDDLPSTGEEGSGLAPSGDPTFPTGTTVIEETDAETFPDVILTDSITETTGLISDGDTITSVNIGAVGLNTAFVDGDTINLISSNNSDVQQLTVNNVSFAFSNQSANTSVTVDSATISGNYPTGSFVSLDDATIASALGFARLKTIRFQIYEYNEEIASLTNSATKGAFWATRTFAQEYIGAKIIGLRAYVYDLGAQSSPNGATITLKKNPSSPATIGSLNINNGWPSSTTFTFGNAIAFTDIEPNTGYFFEVTTTGTGARPEGLWVEILYTKIFN